MVDFDVAEQLCIRTVNRVSEVLGSLSGPRAASSVARGTLSLRPLSPALGVELEGLDIGTVTSAALRCVLFGALLERRLVLLRGLELDAESFRRLSGLLGPLRTVPRGMQRASGMSDVQALTNLGPDGRPTSRNPDPESLYWHSDGSATRTPARFTLLYALRVPREGGETVFADAAAACSVLSPAERRELIGCRAAHDPEVARWVRRGTVVASGRMVDRILLRLRLLARLLAPPVHHPVIRVHEETGREALFVGDHAWRMMNMRWRDGRRRLDELTTFVTSRPEWTYRHAWKPGDLLIWDNRNILHRGSAYDTSEQVRVMLRAVVAGDRPSIAADR